MHANRENYLKIGLIILSWALISQLLFYSSHYYFVSQLPAELLGSIEYPAIYIQISYLSMSILGGAFFGYRMVMRKPESSTFTGSILHISFLYVSAFLVSVMVVTTTITMINAGLSGIALIPGIVFGVVTNPPTIVSFVIWALIVAGTQFMLQVNDMFGQGVLKNFITGRYFKPKEEERIFMFMDLQSSTTIAEKLGHHSFFELMSDLFKDVTGPIMDHGGEIYQYVGDEVVVCWQLSNGIRQHNCIRCFSAVQEKLNSLQDDYLAKFDVVPHFKAGVHHGKVMIGEVGVIKKDIVYSGDVLNTTSRIQELCKDYGVNCIISQDTLLLVEGSITSKYQSLGAIDLRGKSKRVNLYSFSPQ